MKTPPKPSKDCESITHYKARRALYLHENKLSDFAILELGDKVLSSDKK